MSAGARETARNLAKAALARGEPAGWFEPLYRGADGNTDAIPWADLRPNPHLLAWLDRDDQRVAAGGRALVVGCGLGDDAEELARRGFEVVAFDVAPSAVAWCRRRFPRSAVTYAVADVLDAPVAWESAFDLVVEIYTLQALPADVRPRAIDGVARCLAPGGRLLLIAQGRDPDDDAVGPPWPLTRQEIGRFVDHGLREAAFEDFLDADEPTVRRFRVEYFAADQSALGRSSPP